MLTHTAFVGDLIAASAHERTHVQELGRLGGSVESLHRTAAPVAVL